MPKFIKLTRKIYSSLEGRDILVNIDNIAYIDGSYICFNAAGDDQTIDLIVNESFEEMETLINGQS